MHLSCDPICRLCRVVFCLTMALAWAGAPQASAAQNAAQRPAADVRLTQVRNSLRALEDAVKELPRDSFEVGAVLQETGNDPDAMFQWVRDRTCWVPYHGLMREDVGALMDRLGNSLDRAYLLASLLKASGRDVRLAHAQLDPALAESLVRKVRLLPVPKKPAPSTKENPYVAAARQYGIDQQLAGRVIAQCASQTWRVGQEVFQRTSQQVPLVTAQIGKPPKDVAAGDHAAAVAAMQDHWWVQWNDQGNWTDLDPLLPDAKAKSTLAPAQQTVDLNSIPDDQRHRVVVRVIVEAWKDKRPGEVAVLEHSFRPAAVAGKQIHLGHFPIGWPADFNPADARDMQNRLKTAVMAVHEWVPMLVLGGETFMQSSFNDAGEINTKPNLNAMSGAGKSVAGAGKGVLDAFGSGNDAPPPPSGTVTGEWIEYEIKSPGQPDRRIRRQVFDLIGPAARAAGNLPMPALTDTQKLSRGLELFGQTDMLICGCRVSAIFLTARSLQAILASQKLYLAQAADDPALSDPAKARALVEQIKEMPGGLEDLAYTRMLAGKFSNGIFIAQPNILTQHIRLHLTEGGQIMGCKAFDIVANEVGVRPRYPADPFAVRLEQGVIDTNLESALLTGCGLLHSAAETLTAAGSDPGQWTALRGANDPALAQLSVSPDAKNRIAADLSAGAEVIIPRSSGAGFVSWWRVDPNTGTTLGIGENGWGPSMTEYAIVVLVVFVAIFIGCEAGVSLGNSQMTAGEAFKFCFLAALAAAIIAVVTILLIEAFAAAAAEGAGGAGGAGAGGAGGAGGPPVNPWGPTMPGGPGPLGGGAPPPMPSGPPPLPGGGPPPMPGGGGGGGAPFDPFGGTMPGGPASPLAKSIGGLGGLGGGM